MPDSDASNLKTIDVRAVNLKYSDIDYRVPICLYCSKEVPEGACVRETSSYYEKIFVDYWHAECWGPIDE